MLDILFISDYVCPYCLVAKEALRQAMLETGMEAKITYQPHELTLEPEERVDTYNDKVRKIRYQFLVPACESLGLDMKLPPKVIPRPYSRLAFEGWYYACDKGEGDRYNDLMYKAYFMDEKDIGDLDVLVSLAESIGLDGADFRKALEEGIYSQVEKEAVTYTREVLKPKGVPTLYINGEELMLKKYTKEEMMDILLERNVDDGAPMMFCGVDGCH